MRLIIAVRSTRGTGRQIYPLGFLPVIEPTVVDASGTAGVRGLFNKWTYDASGEYGHNSFAFSIGDTLNVSLGPSMPPNKTQFDAGTLELNQFVGNIDVSRPFTVASLAGPVNIAFGAEYRRENYQIRAGEPDSYGDGGLATSSVRAPPSGPRCFLDSVHRTRWTRRASNTYSSKRGRGSAQRVQLSGGAVTLIRSQARSSQPLDGCGHRVRRRTGWAGRPW